MRKRDSFAYILCMCLALALFAGCTQKDEGTDVSTEASVITYIIADNSAEGHLAKLIEIANMDETEDSAFNNLSFEETSILEYGTRNFGYGDSTYSLIFFKIASAHSSWPGGSYFLCIERDEQFTYYYCGSGSFSDNSFSLNDFDGDGYDEILVCYGNFANTSSATNAILKVTDEGMGVLFLADGTNDPSAQVNWVDTEFEFTFDDDYTIAFRSLPMNYTATFEAHEIFDEQMLEIFYDSEGLVNINHTLYETYFKKGVWINNRALHNLSVKPVDIDNDGTYEIITMREFLYSWHAATEIGTEFALLKYNPETKSFEIIDVAFEVNWGKREWMLNNLDYEIFGVPIREIYAVENL